MALRRPSVNGDLRGCTEAEQRCSGLRGPAVVLEHLGWPGWLADFAAPPHFLEVRGKIVDRAAVDRVQVGDVQVQAIDPDYPGTAGLRPSSLHQHGRIRAVDPTAPFRMVRRRAGGEDRGCCPGQPASPGRPGRSRRRPDQAAPRRGSPLAACPEGGRVSALSFTPPGLERAPRLVSGAGLARRRPAGYRLAGRRTLVRAPIE